MKRWVESLTPSYFRTLLASSCSHPLVHESSLLWICARYNYDKCISMFYLSCNRFDASERKIMARKAKTCLWDLCFVNNNLLFYILSYVCGTHWGGRNGSKGKKRHAAVVGDIDVISKNLVCAVNTTPSKIIVFFNFNFTGGFWCDFKHFFYPWHQGFTVFFLRLFSSVFLP